MITKYASYEASEILDLKGTRIKSRGASLNKVADFEDYRTGDGYLYARIRAISSRVNKNHDGWPSVELAGSKEIFDRHHSGQGFTIEASEGNSTYGFATFIGKPIFVDHHNSNPKKARGVIVDAKLNVLDHKTASIHDSYWGGSDIDSEHLPPTEVELLLEVDAKSFPRLAQAIVSGDLDGFSMGCDVDYSKCSHCGHTATNPDEYCSHVMMKGAHHDFKTADGKRVSKKSYENCYGIKFFEISAVFEPADETARAREVKSAVHKESVMMDYDPETGKFYPSEAEDPVRTPGRELDVENRAMQIPRSPHLNDQHAQELAVERDNRELQGQIPGNGQTYTPKQWHYLPGSQVNLQGMPYGPEGQQPPPPLKEFEQSPGATNREFFNDAQDMLNEAYPKRPRMNDPRWSFKHKAVGPDGYLTPEEQALIQEQTSKGTDGTWMNQHHQQMGQPLSPWYVEGPSIDKINPGGLHSITTPPVHRDPDPSFPDQTRYVDPSLLKNVPPRQGSVKHSENELPQDMHVRAPDEIDTLRKEQTCPICGNDMEAETCAVCGYVQPPKEYDNPDLDKAKQIRQEMKDAEEQESTSPPTEAQPDGQPQQGGPNQTPPAPGMGASKAPSTAKVKSDMHNWTPKVHPKTAARINQIERPVNASNVPTSNEPQTEIVTKDQTRPVTATMRTAQEIIANANAKRNHTGASMGTRTADGPTPPGDTSPHKRVNVMDVGGVDTASNEEASKTNETTTGKPNSGGFAQVDVMAVGGTGVENVEADKEESLPTAGEKTDDSGFNKDKTTEDSGPTKTWGDKDGEHSGVTDPVTREKPYWIDESKWSKRLAYEDGPLEGLDQQGDPVAQGGTAVKGVQPIAEQFGERVNVLERKTSPENNSGPTTTWTGTDGNGVLKQQPPVTREDMEWGGVKVPDVQLHTTGKVSLSALRLAEAEVELGLIDPKEKYNRMVEHDAKHPSVVQAELETLSRVKTAGLAKLATQRQAKRVPSFKRIAHGASQQEAVPVSDESLDAGLFLK